MRLRVPGLIVLGALCGCPANSTSGTSSEPAEGASAPGPGEDGSAEPEPEPEPEPAEPEPAEPEPAEPGASSAAELRIDGFGLGTKASELIERGAPYDKPCDLDRLPAVGRSALLYAGKECNGHSFPEDTTLLLFLALAPGDDEQDTDANLAQPIEALGWMGGSHFQDKANLPVDLGAKKAEVDAALGTPSETFQIGTAVEAVTDDPDPKPVGDPLLAHHHAGDLWSVTRSDLAVAFVAGKMPSDAENEQWRSISRLFFTYVAD